MPIIPYTKKKASVNWSEILSKPLTFIPSAHTHSNDDITGLAAVATSGAYSDITGKPKIFVTTVTTTSGAWTADLTAAGFTSPPVVIPVAILSSVNVYDRAWASLSAVPTTTSVSGYGLRGANLLALGATTRTVPDGTVIHIIAIGS